MRAASLPLLALALSACAAFNRPRDAYTLSSERSEYSPTLRLAIAVADSGDSIVVRVDGGTVVAPGSVGGAPRVVMRNLHVQALVARASTPVEGAPPEPWSPLAASESAPLADSLLLGIPRELGPMRFAIARPEGLDPRRAWLVFRIVGQAITTPVRYSDGTEVASRAVEGGVRVFACADRTLSGHLDRTRRKKLERAYLSAC